MLFFKKEKIHCGGEGCIEVKKKDSLFSKAYLYYERPTYELILQYEWDYTNFLQSDTERKALEKAQKESYAMVAKKIFLPYAKKIFLRSNGFVDGKGNFIDHLSVVEQFEHIEKYRGYTLIDMATKAFQVDVTSKKKF